MPINIRAARANLVLREKKRRVALHRQFTAARRDAAKIVGMIVKRYEPVRIYQWGSLLDKRQFEAYSDIDIAIEGIGSAERFFSLCRDADHLTNFPLDIVELEKIDPLHAASIRRKGRRVYGRE